MAAEVVAIDVDPNVAAVVALVNSVAFVGKTVVAMAAAAPHFPLLAEPTAQSGNLSSPK